MPLARTQRVFGIRLKAKNDINGNPRRCWVVFNVEGLRIDTIDEGYVGASAFVDRYPGGVPLMHVPVTVATYRAELRVPRREP